MDTQANLLTDLTRLKLRLIRSVPFSDGEQLMEVQVSMPDFENTPAGHAKAIAFFAKIMDQSNSDIIDEGLV